MRSFRVQRIQGRHYSTGVCDGGHLRSIAICDASQGIFTNAHVVAGGIDIAFVPELTSNSIEMKLYAAWPELDLALLKPSDSDALTDARVS